MTTHAGIPVLVWLVKVAVLLALGRAAVAQPVFSTVTVENSPGDVGQYTSLGVDKNGRVQISYYDATTGKLKVARMPADGSWEIQVVDEVGDVGLYTSLFVYPPDDPLTPSVSYYRADSEQLKVTCFESSWQTLPGLSARIEVCKATALAVVRGMPIVAYVDTDQRALKLAIYSDNQWKEEPAAPVSLPPDLAMAYNRDEEPRIVYADGSELWLAWKDCDGKCLDLTQPAWPTGVGPWHFEAIHLSDPEPRGGIDCVSVAVRPDDRVYVAYCDGHLKCATGTRTGLATWEWDVHVVDESDFLWESDCSIALGPGPDFVPHLCYSTSGSGLKYVRLDQEQWSEPITVDSGNVGRYNALAVDARGGVHISYYDAANTNLKYAHLGGLPDLAVTSVHPLTSQVDPGQAVRFVYTVANIGDEGPAGISTFDVATFLSRDRVFDNTDIELPNGYCVSTFHLAPEWSNQRFVSAPVPRTVPDGLYYMIVVADVRPGQPPNYYPGVLEANEQNNWRASETPVRIGGPPPAPVDNLVDLRLGQIAYDRATARFYVDVTVTNSSDPGLAICIPLWLVAEGVAPGYATLVAADGVTSDGDPYLDLSTLLGDGRLDPGESVTRRVYFRSATWVPTNIDPGLSVYGVICYTTPFP